MRTGRFSLWSAVTVLSLLASLTFGQTARADGTEQLVLNGPFNTFDYTLGTQNVGNPGGSGPIQGATLGGLAVTVYCIDIPDNVNVPGTYNSNYVSTAGTAVYNNPAGTGDYNTWASGNSLVTVNTATVAGEIAWLMNTYALSATTTTEQDALQAAIWTEIYGSKFSVTYPTTSQAAIYNQMLTYLSGVGSDSLSSALWLSPAGVNNTAVQALVAIYTTPEPSTFAIAALSGAGFIFYGLRRRKAKGA